MVKTKLLLVALCGLFCASSCRKEEELPLKKLSQEFLSYVSFPVGSWWVYEETTTKERDSVYVSQNNYDIIIEKGGKSRFEYRAVFYQSSQTGEELFMLKYDWATSLRLGMEVSRFVLPVPRGVHGFIGDEKFSMAEQRDTMTIGKTQYKQVYRASSASQQSASHLITIEWLAKDVGFIKRVYFDGREWDLIKHHIN